MTWCPLLCYPLSPSPVNIERFFKLDAKFCRNFFSSQALNSFLKRREEAQRERQEIRRKSIEEKKQKRGKLLEEKKKQQESKKQAKSKKQQATKGKARQAGRQSKKEGWMDVGEEGTSLDAMVRNCLLPTSRLTVLQVLKTEIPFRWWIVVCRNMLKYVYCRENIRPAPSRLPSQVLLCLQPSCCLSLRPHKWCKQKSYCSYIYWNIASGQAAARAEWKSSSKECDE